MEFKAGDKVKIREDATTEGEPFGELFLKLTWEVVAQNGDGIELKSQLYQTEVKLHTLAHKLELVERPGAN